MEEPGAFGPEGGGDAPQQARPALAAHSALFILHQVFDTFRSPVLLEPLAAALLRPVIAEELAVALHTYGMHLTEPKAASAPQWGGPDGWLVPNPLRGHFL